MSLIHALATEHDMNTRNPRRVIRAVVYSFVQFIYSAQVIYFSSFASFGSEIWGTIA